MAIVCQCVPVRDRAIVNAIHRGAATLADVQAACEAGTQCGGCEPAIEALLACHVDPAADQPGPRTSGARA
jgi:NAD(P)H-nitrite reductase large subunit